MATKTETQSVVTLVINGEGAKTSLKELGQAVNQVNTELRKMKEADDPSAYADVLKSKKALTAEYLKQKIAIGDVRSSFQKFKDEAMTMATGVIGGNLLTWMGTQLLSVIPNAIDKVMKKKDALADIMKTTQMTDGEVKNLDRSLAQIYSRTNQGDRRGMAAVAGQFGIAKDEIAKFVEGVDKANVALGDAMGGAEATATTLAKLDHVFKDIKGNDVGERVLHIANALNVLEDSGVATSPVIADFSARIGRALGPLQVGTDKILGLSASLEEMNLTAELGSTAIIETFQRMRSESEVFAKVAGVPLKEYRDLINKDIYGAFMKYLEGLKKVQGDNIKFNEVLEKSKLTGSGASQTLTALVANLDMVKGRVQVVGSALENTNSIQAEFNSRNYDLAVNLQKIAGWWDRLINSSALQGFIADMVSGVAALLGLTDEVRTATEAFSKQSATVKNLTTNIEPLLSRYDVLKSKTKLSKVEQTELKDVIGKISTSIPEAITQFDAYGNALNINSKKAREAILVQKELLKFYNKTAIAEVVEKHKGDRSDYQKTRAELQSGKIYGQTAKGVYGERDMTGEEIRERQKKLNDLMEQEKSNILLYKGLTGQAMNEPIATAKADDKTPLVVGDSSLDLGGDGKGKGKKEKILTPEDISKEAWKNEQAVNTQLKKYREEQDKFELEEKKKQLEVNLHELAAWKEEQDFALELDHAKGLMSEEEYLTQKSDLTHNALMAEKLLKDANGLDILDVQRKLNDLEIEEATRVTAAKKDNESSVFEHRKALQQKEVELQQVQNDTKKLIYNDGLTALMGVLDKQSGLYKIAFAVQKALAIAEIVVQGQKAYAGYTTAAAFAASVYDYVGAAVFEALAVKSVVQAGVAAAVVAAQAYQGLTGREHGGYTGVSDLVTSNANGYVDKPTLFSLGSRQFIAGEGSKREYVISSEALQYGPVANFAAMLDVAQRSGSLGQIGNNAGQNISGSSDNMAVVAAIGALAADIKQLQARPLVFNSTKFQEHQDFLIHTQNATSA
jgi:hypothetical protein